MRFIRGRLKFGGSKNSAPFPSAVVVMRPATRRTDSSGTSTAWPVTWTHDGEGCDGYVPKGILAETDPRRPQEARGAAGREQTSGNAPTRQASVGDVPAPSIRADLHDETLTTARGV